MNWFTKDSKIALLLNVVAAIGLLFLLPQRSIVDGDIGWLKVTSIMLVDLCAIAMILHWTYKLAAKKRTA